MKYRKFLVLLWLIPLVLYYSDRRDGPDHVTYRTVAEKILKGGHLNILGACGDGHPREVSPTLHHPIFQTIGGAVFFIPPMIMAPISRDLTSLSPIWSGRFRSLAFHQSIWECFIAWLLGFWTCLLAYRIARIYYSVRAAGASVAICALGGPILIFVARWPCQTNLPTAFLSVLLLYVYHFADRRKYLSWFLMGAIWGFGVFVRNEFIIWALLPAYGIFLEIRSREQWKKIALHCLLLLLPAGGYLVATFLIQVILYGSWGNTYGVLIDPKLLAEMPRMLFGPRNGLFSFWPILLLAIIGYMVKFRKNPGINHLLFGIILSAFAVCIVFPFWLAEGGQRPMLMVMPCFMVFLARLLDEKRRFFWICLIIGIGCVFWAVLIFFLYGNGWMQADGSVGFLKANTLPEMLIFVSGHAKEFLPKVIGFLFLPKQRVIWLILPIIIPIFLIIVVLQKIIPRRKALLLLAVVLSIFCVVILMFLSGAGGRGREYYYSISQEQPEGWFVYNCRYHFGEYFINSLDFVAYYLEYDQPDTAAYFEERAVKFLQKIAPQHIQEFKQVCEAFRIRRSLGWKRVYPAGPTEDLVLWLRWYYNQGRANVHSMDMVRSFFSETRDEKRHGNTAPQKSYNFRSDFKDIINDYRIPGELLQR